MTDAELIAKVRAAAETLLSSTHHYTAQPVCARAAKLEAM